LFFGRSGHFGFTCNLLGARLRRQCFFGRYASIN
jgi:hypothetical protein